MVFSPPPPPLSRFYHCDQLSEWDLQTLTDFMVSEYLEGKNLLHASYYVTLISDLAAQ